MLPDYTLIAKLTLEGASTTAVSEKTTPAPLPRVTKPAQQSYYQDREPRLAMGRYQDQVHACLLGGVTGLEPRGNRGFRPREPLERNRSDSSWMGTESFDVK